MMMLYDSCIQQNSLTCEMFRPVKWPEYKLCSNHVLLLICHNFGLDKSCSFKPLHFTPHCFFNAVLNNYTAVGTNSHSLPFIFNALQLNYFCTNYVQLYWKSELQISSFDFGSFCLLIYSAGARFSSVGKQNTLQDEIWPQQR